MLLAESGLALAFGNVREVDELLGARSLEDETQEALEAVAMAREETPA